MSAGTKKALRDVWSWRYVLGRLLVYGSFGAVMSGCSLQLSTIEAGGTSFSLILSSLAILMVLGLGVGLVYYKKVYEHKIRQLKNWNEERKKYQLSSLDQEASLLTLHKVREYLESSKVYLQADLSIQDVATAIDVHHRYISQAINENLGQGFRHFVNTYRIAEVKRRLKDPEYKRYTMVAIAESCGLKSKSTFNRTFKKVTGLTPSEYLEKEFPGSE
ncbi:AraC-like DNA-binding protein [Marinoscillum furvescens DSM 4134]|uniref:AraC-like DNA-binding protein n=1 Tax=Marinoscillum furvescens DSM 4134 TaxID=1122208 RepID=A0A3D9L0H1_MARFU|nr:AraC-like DNA-binding protein [Marinoscillum furvescens DSM 4134]